ncbi:MAG TPA: hypothetical protein VHR72_00115 [Gemmataceae bacterium]|nr:hypothetical protein [Gemmataceae bacterium]
MESEKLVKSLFKADFAKTKAADRAALAAKLLEQAVDSKDDLKAKYVLLREARDMAAKAGDSEVYLKAADEMAASYKISAAEARAASIDALAAGVTGADSARDAGNALLEAVDGALGVGDFDAAQKLLRGTEIVGRKAGVAPLTATIGLRAKSLAHLRKEYEKIAEAQKKLESTPTDGAANLLVGKFLCFVKNDWENGLPRLALGNDDGLRTAAEKDSKAATGTAADKVEAGDTWSKHAGDLDPLEKSNLQARALHWYRESLSDVTGLAKVKVEKRIEELTKTSPAAAGASLAKWTTIKNAVKNGNLKDWQIVGGTFSQKTYREVPPTGAILIGFRYSATLNNRIPDFFQAIYRGPKGEFNGAPAGAVNARKPILVAKAKTGYAVGAIFTRGGGWLDAVQPIFMKMTATGVDPNDSYKGPYLGGEGGTAATMGGDGNFIVGIHGKIDSNNGRIQAISAVTMTNNETAAPTTTKKKRTN